MSRRRSRPAPPSVTPADRKRHVRDWRVLAGDALAAATDPLGLPSAELKDLGDRATAAGPTWAWPIDWPDGLLFETLVVGTRAFCRGSDSLRDRLQGPLAGTARAVIDALDDLAATPEAPPAPEAEPNPVRASRRPSGRLPYAEDRD